MGAFGNDIANVNEFVRARVIRELFEELLKRVVTSMDIAYYDSSAILGIYARIKTYSSQISQYDAPV